MPVIKLLVIELISYTIQTYHKIAASIYEFYHVTE